LAWGIPSKSSDEKNAGQVGARVQKPTQPLTTEEMTMANNKNDHRIIIRAYIVHKDDADRISVAIDEAAEKAGACHALVIETREMAEQEWEGYQKAEVRPAPIM
jgi:hypothetical protein